MYSYENMFITTKLPGPLSKSEITFLIEKSRDGDESARDKIALHNIRLVINVVLKRFNKSDYDGDELVSVGLIGLVKAIDTFDEKQNKAFSSYAVKCIENEIFMFIKKRYVKEDSLEDIISVNKDGNMLKRHDIIYDKNFDVELEYERKEIISIVNGVVEQLNGRDREVIKLYFGFYDDRQYSQNEIAIMMGMTRSNVSRIMKNSLEIMGRELRNCDVLSSRGFRIRSWIYNTQNKNGNDIEDISVLGTIYGYFHNYSCQQINKVLEMLNEDELELLVLRYGMDFDNPISDSKMIMTDIDKLYGIVMPKIRKLLNELSYTDGYKKKLLLS